MENDPNVPERHCVVEGCTHPGQIRRGLCPFHYRIARKTGEFPEVQQVDNRKRGRPKAKKEFANCKTCGKEFGFFRCQRSGTFCSKECWRKDWENNWKEYRKPLPKYPKGHVPWNKGKKGCYSEEQLQRMSEAHKGIPCSEAAKEATRKHSKGNKYVLGKHWKQTPEHIEKRRKALIGKPNPWVAGERSNFWKGGVCEKNRELRYYLMGTKDYRRWRSQVLERDNYTCVKCGFTDYYVEADHIKPVVLFPELVFDVNNGQTLCEPCHKKKTADDYRRLLKPKGLGTRPRKKDVL